MTKNGSSPIARLRSKSSWLVSPPSRLTAIETGTITGWTRNSGVASRQTITTARYHIGQRGSVQIGSSIGSPATWWRNCAISHENRK